MSLRSLRWLAIVPIAAIVLALAASNRSSEAGAGITTQSLGPGLTANDLVSSLVGGGVTTSNVTYVGDPVAAGTFSGGAGIVGFDSGVILSSGDISFVVGPNQFTNVTGTNFTPGDPDLSTLSGFTTFDAAVLEFDFVPATDVVLFRFVFASDEYQEWANTEFNDVFAFFVNGSNCAVVPGTGTPISVNTINNGNPGGDPTPHNPTLYRNNDFQVPAPAPFDTEMDGLTVLLTCIAAVNQGVDNHIKLAIADASDAVLDSVVFLQANSLVGAGPGDTDCNSLINAIDALFALRFAAGLTVSGQCIPNADVNCSGNINSVDALLILRFAAALSVNLPPGCPPIGSGPPSPPPSASPTPGVLAVNTQDDFFDPDTLIVTAGQPFQAGVTNIGVNPHNLHFVGNDNMFGTVDDVSTPVLFNGDSEQIQGQVTNPGVYDFICDVHGVVMAGTITAV